MVRQVLVVGASDNEVGSQARTRAQVCDANYTRQGSRILLQDAPG